MKLLFTLLLSILMLSAIIPQNYKEVKIYISGRTDVVYLAKQGFALDEAKYVRKDNSLILFLSDREFEKLESSGLRFEVLISDWNKYYASISIENKAEESAALLKSRELYGISDFEYGSMGGHYTFQEVLNKLDSIHIQYPSLTTQKFQIGNSVENRPIYAIKISDNPDMNENEPEVLYTSLTHAREPGGMMTVMYFIYYLLENYGTDPEATYLVNNRQLYFIPVVNPDGYEYNRLTNPNGGGMWRKNRKSPDGIDLNRNYGYEWGYDNIGSSPNQYDETYRGTGPFSESETQAVRDFCNAHNFKSALNYHTYGNDLITPWGYTDQPTPDSTAYNEFGTDMTKYNNYTLGTGTGTVGYITNGDSDDWMYGEQTTKGKIISFTPEVGNNSDGFWAPKSRIIQIAQENIFPNLYLAWIAGGYVNLSSYSFDKTYFYPGDDVKISIVLKNKGMSDAQNLSVQLVSLNPDITVDNPTMNLSALTARSEVNLNSAFSFKISSSADTQNKAKLVLNTFIDAVPMASDTLSIFIGFPQFVFIDTTNNISDLWTMSGTASWSNTTTTYYSAPDCYTDSKSGNYANNTNAYMTLKNQIDLTGISNPIFTFWTKYDLENGYDYGQVKFSTNNGTSWFTLPGKYSVLGSGTFQPSGQNLYNAYQPDWVQEEIDISSLTGKQIKIRFELHSDAYVTKDGWYIDDIGIVHYVNLPVELTSFTAVSENNSVLLNWTTATELNNKGFEVQRSKDNIYWEKLYFVTGSGTTNGICEYSYRDIEPLIGKSYYRIVQIDFNGTAKESKSIAVYFLNNLTYDLKQNYPNPFNPSTNIEYQIPEEGFVTLKVLNTLGQEIITLVNEEKSAGTFNYQFSIINNQLTSGIYFYRLKVIGKSGNVFISTKKMLLIK